MGGTRKNKDVRCPDTKKKIDEMECRLCKLYKAKDRMTKDIDCLLSSLQDVERQICQVKRNLERLRIEQETREKECKILAEIGELQKLKDKVTQEEKCLDNRICRRLNEIRRLKNRTKSKMACIS